MRPLIALATIFALLVHASLGCCAHHAKSAKPKADATEVCGCCPGSAMEVGDGHAHRSIDPPIGSLACCQATSGRSPAAPCSGAHCAFLRTAKADNSLALAKPAPFVTTIARQDASAAPLAPLYLRGEIPKARAGGLHLLYRVILI